MLHLGSFTRTPRCVQGLEQSAVAAILDAVARGQGEGDPGGSKSRKELQRHDKASTQGERVTRKLGEPFVGDFSTEMTQSWGFCPELGPINSCMARVESSPCWASVSS